MVLSTSVRNTLPSILPVVEVGVGVDVIVGVSDGVSVSVGVAVSVGINVGTWVGVGVAVGKASKVGRGSECGLGSDIFWRWATGRQYQGEQNHEDETFHRYPPVG